MDEELPPEAVEFVDDRPLAEKIGDKNWKSRQSAYEELKKLVQVENCDAGTYTEYASWLPKMTADSNASALDTGLDCAIAFVDSAPNGVCQPYYDKLFANIVDKTFSGRASTLQKGKTLMLKMIEVDDATACTAFLLTKLGDKKPKIPPTSLDVLREGIEMYGVKAFPVKDIIKALPTVFNGSNSAARDAAMALAVEVYRWIRQAPLQAMLDGLRTAQKTDFERIVAEKSEEFASRAAVPTVYLRKERPAPGSEAAQAAAGAAAGPAAAGGAGAAGSGGGGDSRDYVDEVDLMKKLKGTDFSTLVAEEKWSEQLKGLQLVIDAIGPVPKIKASTEVYDLVTVLKGFLRQGHLQLQVASLKILSLLADGMRGPFGTTLRPVLQQVVGKCKEKRLVPEVQAVLLAAFAHCLPYDAANDDVIEFVGNKKSPPHGKVGLMEVVARTCATLPDKVGTDCLKPLAAMLVGETEDPDPKVREGAIAALAAVGTLAKSRGRLAADAWKVVSTMENTLPKVYKRVQSLMEGGGALAATSGSGPSAASAKFSATEPTVAPTASVAPSASTAGPATVKKAVSALGKTTSSLPSAAAAKKATSGLASTSSAGSLPTAGGSKKAAGGGGGAGSAAAAEDDQPEDLTLSPEEAVAQLAAMEIPGWTETGLPGLESAKWQDKVEALGAIERRLSDLEASGSGSAQFSAALVRYLAATSSGFKISNINILKAVLQTAVAIVKTTGPGVRFNRAAGWELLKALGDKLADKKTKDAVQQLLSALAAAASPLFVVKRMKVVMDKCVSPLAHQYYLEWLKEAVAEFGCGAFPVPQLGAFCTAEMDNKNATVRTAAVEVMGALYHQIGPRLAAIAFSDDMKPQLKALVEAEFTKVGYDPSAAAKAPKAGAGAGGDAGAAGGGGASAAGGIPRQDLCGMLDKNIVAELGFTDGKNSWQRRKVAMEAIVAACERSAHYLEANKPTGEIVKALKPRMNDTQANLKPIAVSAIAHIVASLDPRTAGTKVLTSIAPAMMIGLADNKKPMRDSTIAALQLAVTGQVETEGAATARADPGMLAAVLPAAAESLVNVVGRQELLVWLSQHTDSMKGDLSELVVPLVLTLQDKTASVRAAGEALLTSLLAHSLTTKAALDKATRDLPPATKRAMQASIDRMMAAHGTAPAKPAAAPTSVAAVTPAVLEPAPAPATAVTARSSAAAPAVAAPASPPRSVPSAQPAVPDSPPLPPFQNRVVDSPAVPAAAKKMAHTPAPPTPAAHGAATPGSASAAGGVKWTLKRNAMGKLRRQEEGHRLNWPQPPDAPGEMEMAALKVVWRPLVDPTLAHSLFPLLRPGSPVNQDVYIPAMRLLTDQITCPYLTHHTEFLLRWCCIVLCAKMESLPSLFQLLELLCDILETIYREAGTAALTDAEVSCILPHLVDRCGHRSEKHSAHLRHAVLLIGQIIGPAKLTAAFVHGLRSHNKRSRLICLEELQGLVAAEGLAHVTPAALKEIAACLDSKDGDNAARAACLELISAVYDLMGKDMAKLKKTIGSDVSDVTLSLIEDKLEPRTRRQPATPAASATAVTAASGLGRTPSFTAPTPVAVPATAARMSRTPAVKAETPAAPNTVAAPTPGAVAPASPPVSGEKLSVDTEGVANRDVWAATASEEEAAAPESLSPSAKRMLEQIDRVIAATPLPTQRSQRNIREGSAEKAPTPSYAQSSPLVEVAGPSTPLTAPAPSTAVAQTPDDEGEFGDTVGSLPSEFRSPAPLAKTMNSRLSLCRGEAVDESAVVQELNDLYDEIVEKVDALLDTPQGHSASTKVQDECKDYLKMLHSIVNGEWSVEKLPQDEAVLLARSESLVTRLCGCIARAFEVHVTEGRAAVSSPVAIGGVDVSLLAISLSVLFSLVKRPDVAAALSEDALFAVFHECLHSICDTRITQAAQQSEEVAAEGRETAQQVARALNNIVLKLGLGGQTGPVIMAMLRVMFCCIPANEVAQYSDHQPLPPSSTKPASRLVIQILSDHGNSSAPYSEPQVQLRPLLEAIHHFFTRHPTSTANDTPFRTVKTILNEIVVVKGGAAVLDVLRQTSIPHTAFIYLLTCRLGSVKVVEPPTDLHAQIVAVIDDITSSRDKISAIKELHRLKLAHPEVDINLYLQKISSAFRRYVLSTLEKFDSAEPEADADADEGTENTAVDTNTQQAFPSQPEAASVEAVSKTPAKTPSAGVGAASRTPQTARDTVHTPAVSEYSSARSTPYTAHSAATVTPATGAASAYKAGGSSYTPSAYVAHKADATPSTGAPGATASRAYAANDGSEAMRILDNIKARPAQVAAAAAAHPTAGSGGQRSYDLDYVPAPNAGAATPGRPDSGDAPAATAGSATPSTGTKQKRFAFNPETKRMEIVVVNSTDGSPGGSPVGLKGENSPFARRNDIIRNSLSSLTASLDLPRTAGASNPYSSTL